MSTHQVIGNIMTVSSLAYLGAILFLAASASGQDAVKASSANITAYNTPYAYYDYERDPRRWFGQGQGHGFGSYAGPLAQFPGGLEAIAIGLMLAVGAGFIAIPLMIILYMIFIGPNSGGHPLSGGFGFMQHPTTTTIAGRKRREILGNMIPEITPQAQEKVISFLKKLADAPDRMEYLKNFLKP